MKHHAVFRITRKRKVKAKTSWYFNGPTLRVQIGFDSDFNASTNTKVSLPETLHPALVDSGATESCIDSALAKVLDLPIVDEEYRSGAHGKHKLNIHLAQIYIPELDWTIFGKFAGVHLIAGGQPHYALIGRTFLQDFTMVYEGNTGVVTIRKE